MKQYRISNSTSMLAFALLIAAGAVQAKKPAAQLSGEGGKLVINTVEAKSVKNAAVLGPVADAADRRPAKSIVLGAPKPPAAEQPLEDAALDGMTFASRLQYVERLMAQAGFSNFKQPLDLSSVTQGQGTVTGQQLAQISDAYSNGSQSLGGALPVVDSVAAHPTSATISCMEFPYKPTGIMSSQNEYNRQILFPHVRKAACDAGIPVGLFDALIVQESRYNALARSHKDAFGLSQLMPGTARQLGVNRYTIYDNLKGGANLMRQLLDDYGEVHLALAAYNAGPGAVNKYNGVPPYRETRNYVATILDQWSRMSSF